MAAKYKDLDRKILHVLSKSPLPQTTKQIKNQVGCAWHTALVQLLRLQIAGKVTGFTTGHAHLWEIIK